MIALLFPGQGSQYIGMGKSLADQFSVARRTFEEADEVLKFKLSSLCFEDGLSNLSRTAYTQPALLTASVAAYRVYMDEIGLRPDYAAGHSLGEFTALTCSGAISFADTLQIVRHRGILMQEADPNGLGVMTAIGQADQKRAEHLCVQISTKEKPVVIGCYNAPEQFVLSGHQEAVNKVAERLGSEMATVNPLRVSSSFHSPMMQPAAEPFNKILSSYSFRQGDYPVISNVTALPHESDHLIERLTRQLTEPVRWQESIDYLRLQNVKIAIELGPKQVLQNLMKKMTSSIITVSQGEASDIPKAKGVFNRENTEPSFIGKCLAIAVATKNRNWDIEAYRKGVIEPYQKVKQLAMHLDQTKQDPTREQMAGALLMLQSVFETKGTPHWEQQKRLKQLLRMPVVKEFTLSEQGDFTWPSF
ncbi:[acyl-carrier-protein] S-malonyltransferase [Paenibacillus sp. UNC496MF]|uniref:ACP S-malonyltransferase n=1 Tax=Paenibacillus sp. UNC496MF TaxID=1502753 RepID=UPI0008F2CE5F|nr:ACP S-malonyltransferase [Paenibacillus sp. UNC496MF]SFJ55907.1 [acyl-carrier-protein] S-malonyltransferase [Paenibacillus sp. UNC496MF]